jgi:hypothetical protein
MSGKKGDPSKYMNSIAEYTSLVNFVDYLNKDQSSLPDWEQELVATLKTTLQARLRDHFENSAKTRSLFVSMPAELWQDENELFNLPEKPRPILGYLPKQELETLNKLVLTPVKGAIEDLRAKLEEFMTKMRASEMDRNDVDSVLALPDFFFADLEAHHDMVDKWQPLCDKKAPLIQELLEREEFLDEVEEFEQNASGDASRYAKGNGLKLAQENKFRAYAAKKMKELDSRAIQICRSYEEETGRPFEIDGVKYLEMIKEQKFGRSENPALSLGKLKPDAISAQARAKYEAQSEAEGMGKKKKSMLDEGKNPNRLIRDGAK